MWLSWLILVIPWDVVNWKFEPWAPFILCSLGERFDWMLKSTFHMLLMIASQRLVQMKRNQWWLYIQCGRPTMPTFNNHPNLFLSELTILVIIFMSVSFHNSAYLLPSRILGCRYMTWCCDCPLGFRLPCLWNEFLGLI